MYAMTDMKFTDEERLDDSLPSIAASGPKDVYPWGLRISLTEKEIAKLDIDPKEAFVGGIVHLHAMARITSVSVNEESDGEHHRIELQIESLCIESEDAENEEAETKEDKPVREKPRAYR